MKKITLALLMLLGGALGASAQTFKEWKDPKINAINRLPMHADFFPFQSEAEALAGNKESAQNFLSLNGYWDFLFVEHAHERPEDFFKLNYKPSGWKKMPVPGVWELNGFGDPLYTNVPYPWSNQSPNTPPLVPEENNHVGSYRKEIYIPENFLNKQVIAHFGAVASNMYLWVNGQFVGYSEDSKLEAEFDISKYLKPGKNLFALQVFRWCDGTFLEDQDFFRYSGIARDCYLIARQPKHLQNIKIQTDFQGDDFSKSSLKIEANLSAAASLSLKLLSPDGKVISHSSHRGKSIATSIPVDKPLLWSAESPSLYTLLATVSDDGKTSETIKQSVGFRKIEIKGSQLLINGQAVLFKGVNRHELDPKTGSVVSDERMLQDVKILKEKNINAVRTSHYPNDNRWYNLCDSFGIYLVAEANVEAHGMGYGDESLAKDGNYKIAHIERNQRNVQRSINHPSVIFWSLGNESGFGENFQDCYNWIKAFDETRPVQYEQALNSKFSDIHCPMYRTYQECEIYANSNPQKPFIQCEYAHAMGNSQGGFKEYWQLYRKYPSLQGGFIWDFVDQSPHAHRNGKRFYAYGGDFNPYDYSDQNFCDNGLLNPDRISNPHADEVSYFYQNIWTSIKDIQAGRIEIFNENFFRSLDGYFLEWEILSEGTPIQKGIVWDISLQPQCRTEITLPYSLTNNNKEIFLRLYFRLKNGETLLPAGHIAARAEHQLSTYNFSTEPKEIHPSFANLSIKDNDKQFLRIISDNIQIDFSKSTGFLSKYIVNGTNFLLDGASLLPNFWRAPTDNDFGAGLQKKYIQWKNPTYKLTDFTHETFHDSLRISVKYLIENIGAQLHLSYVIRKDGSINVKQNLIPGTSPASDLFRFGMKMQLPKHFSILNFYGRGPIENYSDRNHSTFVGLYHQSVKNQFYSYIRPQETGTKTEIRWLQLLSQNGDGIELRSPSLFSASALHYTIDSLDEGLEKHNAHSEFIDEQNLTELTFDFKQMGLGCMNSWGHITREEYRLPYQNYSFEINIIPVWNQY